jgi:hypothetical protein
MKKGISGPRRPVQQCRVSSREDLYRRHGQLTVKHKVHHHEGHEAAFVVVHEVLISHPLLRLAANLAFLCIFPALWHERAVAKVLAHVLYDESGLGQH